MKHTVQQTARLLALGALFFVQASAHAGTQTSQQNLSFSTADQSIWSAGSQYVLDYSKFWGVNWTNGSSMGGVRTPDGLVSANATISTNGGQFGLTPGLSVSGGAASVSYPIQVTLLYPQSGTLHPGDSFTIMTSYVPGSNPSLKTTSPHAVATLDLVVNGSCSASGSGSAVGFSGSGNIFSFTLPSTDTQIFNSDKSIPQGAGKYLINTFLGDLTEGILSGTFNQLAITTYGGLAAPSNSLQSTGEADFFDAQIDFSNAFTDAAGLPPASQNYSLDLGSGSSISANLQILDAYEQLNFKLQQNFQFDPIPRVSLQTSDGQTAVLKIGDSATFTFPASGGNLVITPSYSMGGNLTNTTNLIVTPSLNFTPFDASFDAKINGTTLDSFNLQPVNTFTWDQGDQTFQLYKEIFGLQGFNPEPGASITLAGYSYPMPSISYPIPKVWRPGNFSTAVSLGGQGQPYVVGSGFVTPYTNSKGTTPGSTVYWDDQPTTSSISPSSINPNGEQVLLFTLSDMQASAEGPHEVLVKNPPPGGGVSNVVKVYIDGTPPVTTASLSGPQNANSHGWYNGPVTVSLSSTDTLSGVSDLTYWVDGGSLQAIGSPDTAPGPDTVKTNFQVSGDGMHTVSYTADDRAGNLETTKSTAVNIDGTPPTITGSASPASQNGWNNTPVAVQFTCSDATSGIFSCPSGTTLSSEGRNQGVAGTAVDNAGNSASATVSGINIDLTPPIITYSGNAGTYTVDQTVNITCSSADPVLKDGTPGSGVVSSTCQNITGPAYSFALGVNNFSASATDKAGNVGYGKTSFTVQVTYGSLCNLVQSFVTDSGVATALCSQLAAASAAAARGDLVTKANDIAAFINTVAAQPGKTMTSYQAATLTTLAQAL
jgi:hypothetical protein